MATNVTEKDKTLNEIIDWAKSRCHISIHALHEESDPQRPNSLSNACDFNPRSP